jgi:HK97 family phage major capsid protein
MPLIEERARTWEQAKALLDREQAEKRSLTAEESEQWQRMTDAISQLDKRIEELVSLDTANRKADEQRAEYEKVVRPDVRTAQEKGMAKALAELFRGERKHIDIDLSKVQNRVDLKSGAWEVRDLGEGDLAVPAAPGGHTVPRSFSSTLYEHMIETAAIRQTNVRVLTTNAGELLTLPKVGAFGTAAIVGEGTALAEADPGFGSLTLGAWKYGQLLDVSNELLTDTGVDLVGFIARDLGRALGQVTGTAYITGSGTNAPNGVVTAIKAVSGTAVQGTAGVEADNLITLQYSVIDAYARNGFWMMRRATEGGIRRLKDSNGQYLWAPGLAPGQPSLLLGRPIVSDPNVAAVASAAMSVIFGDFSAYVIRDVAGVRIERSDEFRFSTDQVTWRAILRTDSDLLDTTGAIKGMDTDTAAFGDGA